MELFWSNIYTCQGQSFPTFCSQEFLEHVLFQLFLFYDIENLLPTSSQCIFYLQEEEAIFKKLLWRGCWICYCILVQDKWITWK